MATTDARSETVRCDLLADRGSGVGGEKFIEKLDEKNLSENRD
jgi:hypothetical protein